MTGQYSQRCIIIVCVVFRTHKAQRLTINTLCIEMNPLLFPFILLSHSLSLSLPPSLSLSLYQVKVIAGLGTTVDVILRNGILKEGDTLVLTGTEGPFSTQVCHISSSVPASLLSHSLGRGQLVH